MFWIWLLFAVPVLVQGWCAHKDEFLTARDVQFRRIQGLPFLYHGGMWSDVVLFAPMMAYLISKHGGQWSTLQISVAAAVGFVLSFLMHIFYVQGGKVIPEAHTHDGVLTAAGWIHLAYMAAGIAVLALYYLSTPGLYPTEVWKISGLLFVHFLIGTHVPFKIWVAYERPYWYPAGLVIDVPTAVTLVGCAAVLFALSYVALR